MYYKKGIIALTGLFLCFFLVIHLSANSILLLPESMARGIYNSYSAVLRESPLIKIVAYFLYGAILLHVIYAAIVTFRNKKAKGQKYQVNRYQENSSWTSHNMGLIGVLILIFLVVHLVNFWARIKLGVGESVGLDSSGNVDVYEVTYRLFHNPYYVAFYALLMVPLGLHLNHGLKSAFKSLGFYHYRGLKILARVSLVYATIVSVGFGIIPIIVFFK